MIFVLDLIWDEEGNYVTFPSLSHLITLAETQHQNKRPLNYVDHNKPYYTNGFPVIKT